MTDKENIDHALALLLDKGWCQGTNLDRKGRRCIIGALAYENGIENGLSSRLYRKLLDAAGVKYSLSVWNDTPGRTLGEVLELLYRVRDQV